MEAGNPITMYVTTWCGDCRTARRVLDSHGIAYRTVDITDDRDAREYVTRVNHGHRSVPTIVMPSSRVVVEPSSSELESVLRDEGLLPA